MVSGTVPSSVLKRLFKPAEGGLSVELAAFLEGLDFDAADHRRVTELAEKAQKGLLSEVERQEYETYILLDDLLAILRMKARQSLRALPPTREPARNGG
jgi:hypothetical protein